MQEDTEGMAIATVNPATGETLRTFEALTPAQIEVRLETAAATFRTYRKTSFTDRAKWLNTAGQILDAEKNDLAVIMTTEMGKPVQAARDEAAKCATACRFYAENAPYFLREEIVETSAQRSSIRYQPIGPVLAVMPWNFPFWQVFRFAAPALMAGNVGLLKHAANVPQCALAIEDILRRAGFPEGAFQTLLISSDQVAAVIEDPRVAAVTLTGSVAAGASVASAAGKHIKKTVLELGGSDPFIVMPSADIDEAAKTAVKARTINNGQSCIAAKRFIVAEAIFDQFTEKFVDGMRSLVVGDPMDEKTNIGPLATAQIRDDLHDQVTRAKAAGARVLLGGKPRDGKGFFYEPTVMTGVDESSPIFREETFGPLAAIVPAKNVGHAIALANDSRFGLGAAAWTRDENEIEQFARELEAGSVFINGMVASDPRFPFGGVKKSGYGRELSGFGLREFVNIKTVRISSAGVASSSNTE